MFDNFYDAWQFLVDHPTFEDSYYLNRFQSRCLYVEVVKVNPKTNHIDDNEELNTKVQVWLEAGSYHPDHGVHDIDLDCSGDTYEEAIIKLANLVYKKFGCYEH